MVKMGDRFKLIKSFKNKNGTIVENFDAVYIALGNHTNDILIAEISKEDEHYVKFMEVPYSVFDKAFKPISKKEHNSEYFTDNTFFNAALSRADVVVQTIFHKTTVVAVRFANGFVMVESSSCVTEQNYDKDLGIKLCIKKIEQKYMEHIAFEVCDDAYSWDSAGQAKI